MSEMNGRMNHSHCIPPPALCLQIPSLQACTEGLPLLLQRPDNFPLVMGILQEINQEKVCFSTYAGTHQRPFSISEVKQENADVEEHHQSVNVNSDLYQEWSLKGVEELLTEPAELQLRHDCSLQTHDPGVSHLEVCASDEKPAIALQSVQPYFNWKDSEQSQLHFDEKPSIQLPITIPFEEQVLLQKNAFLHVDEKPLTIEVFSAPLSEISVNSKPQYVVPVHVQDKVGLHSIHAVKVEPEEVEAQAPLFNLQAKSFEEKNGNNGFLDAYQSLNKKASIRLDHDEILMFPWHKSRLKSVQSSEPELELLMENRRLSVHDVQRNTTAVLASRADFTAEGSLSPSGASKKGQGLAEEGKFQSVTSVAEPDCCELTLSLASSKPQAASPSLDGDEDKPVVKPFRGQEKHDGQCRRTTPHQWLHEKARCVSHEYHGHSRHDTMPVGPKKQLFAATDGCSDNSAENPLQNSGSIDHCNVIQGANNLQNNLSQLNAGELFSAPPNCKTHSNFFIDEKGSKQALQSLPRTIDEGSSSEKRESQELVSKGDQVTECNSPMTMESSQAEIAPQFTELQKKKMRGTLPLNDKGDVFSKEEQKDTRCHRSDGKSWRCVRECINGAYYCQYHLRKRRIGYNRRKNREVNQDDFDAVIKESLKPNKKSR